jgi:hypothetical protein
MPVNIFKFFVGGILALFLTFCIIEPAQADTQASPKEMSSALKAFKQWITSLDNDSDIPRDWQEAQVRLSKAFVLVTKANGLNGPDYTLYITYPNSRGCDSFGVRPMGPNSSEFYVYANDNNIQIGLEHFPMADEFGEGYDLLDETIESRIETITEFHASSHPRLQENALRVERERLGRLYNPLREAVMTARRQAAQADLRRAAWVLKNGMPFSWAWKNMKTYRPSCKQATKATS